PTVEARTQRPPSDEDWTAAQERAQHIFGIPASPLPTAANVAALATALQNEARTYRDAVGRLPQALPTATGFVGVDTQVNRARTADAAATIVEALLSNDDVDAIEAFARADVPTSAAAIGRSIKSAGQVATAIESANWELLRTATGLGGDWQAQATGIADRLREAVEADELTKPLQAALEAATSAATSLLGKTVEQKTGDTKDYSTGRPPHGPGGPTGDDRLVSDPGPDNTGASPQPHRFTFDGRSESDREAARARLQELLETVDELSYLDVSWDTRR
ncbi:MAG: hypothetical protein WD336_05155, partial [Trueperaceae bacterium]